jgi:hypothetical protein
MTVRFNNESPRLKVEGRLGEPFRMRLEWLMFGPLQPICVRQARMQGTASLRT